MLAALAIQALAFVVLLYRFRGQAVSPDGRYYASLGEGLRVPPPYSRRWLLPPLLRRGGWRWVSGGAFLATGPLVYALTDELWCVWLMAWLPGFAINVRFPVLVDQAAFALALLAAVLERAGCSVAACAVVFVAGQVKESAPAFAFLLAPTPAMGAASLLSTTTAVFIGSRTGAPKDQAFMLHPFRTAMTKHDPLDWKAMLLPWGGVVIVAALALEQGIALPWWALASIALAYAQLLLANDEVRLYQWAAPALLIALAGYEGPGLWAAMVAHPFLCGAARRV